MANELVARPSLYALADLAFDDFDDALTKVSRRPPGVSLLGGRFGVTADGRDIEIPDPHKLYFVVLGQKKEKSRTYYAEAFDADNPAAPACSSYDGVEPSGGENPISNKCSSCSFAAWGSAKNNKGEDTVACRQYKDLVVHVVGVDGIYLFRIPPGSWEAWDAAVKSVQEVAKAEIAQFGKAAMTLGSCVFSAQFVAKKTGVLEFKREGYVKDAMVPTLLELRSRTDEITELLWGPGEDGVARKARSEAAGKKRTFAKPSSAPALPKPAEEAKGNVTYMAADDAPAPKAKTAPKAPPASEAAATLDSILNSIGDDL